MELLGSRDVGTMGRDRMFVAIDAKLCWDTCCQVLRIVGILGCGH